jgi:hypothetical protein
MLPVKRPSREKYMEISKMQTKPFSCFIDGIRNGVVFDKTNRTIVFHNNKTEEILNKVPINGLMNIKEIHSFAWIKNTEEIPVDVFNIICDTILDNVLKPKTLKITELRNNLYDLLIYNVDVSECIWYIFTTLIEQNRFRKKEYITGIINDIFVFFKYYNNNYRSIYHLESIMLSIINKIHYTT